MWFGCVIAVLLRYFFYFAGAPAYVEEHLVLTTPITSFVRLREGLFLLGAVDVAIACLLRLLAVKYQAAKSIAGEAWLESSLMRKSDDVTSSAAERMLQTVSPAFVGLSYLFNPFVIFSCLAFSLQNLQHLAICGALVLGGAGRAGPAAAMIAIALYLCPFTPIVLIVPVAYLAYMHRVPDRAKLDMTHERGTYVRSKDEFVFDGRFCLHWIVFTLGVFMLLACLLGASLNLMDGQLHFFEASFMSVLAVQDLTPNVGLFWYIFQEVFDRYRPMFLFCFHAHLLFYSAPLHFRVGRHGPIGPWLHATAAVGIMTIFKPYPTSGDYGLMLSTLLIHFELIQECEKMFSFLMSGLLFGLVMFPTMTLVWLTRNAGNANFLYNMTLVVNVFASLLLSEWLKAGMRLRRRQRAASYVRSTLWSKVEEILDMDPAERAAIARGRGPKFQ